MRSNGLYCISCGLIIVPQLAKFLKFMAFWGVIFSRVQWSLSPWTDLNFRHLFSCDAIEWSELYYRPGDPSCSISFCHFWLTQFHKFNWSFCQNIFPDDPDLQLSLLVSSQPSSALIYFNSWSGSKIRPLCKGKIILTLHKSAIFVYDWICYLWL